MREPTMYFSLLMTFGPVAAALSGLIGVVFVLGRRATGDLDNRERSAIGSSYRPVIA
jgi:hypothetical protein